MGSADVIPGVSGGTIAFITGIYDRLVHSISTAFSFFLSVFSFRWKQIKISFKEVDFPLFVPLGTGVVIAIFFFSKFIQYFLTGYTAITYAFFFGLILASALVIYQKMKVRNYEHLIFFALGLVFASFIMGISSLGMSNSLLFIFISGMLAICAMILPGISGAFILLLLGQYEYLISALHAYNLPVISLFSLGALLGLFSFSKALDYFLRKFRSLTLAFLVGLMLGSLRVPFGKILEAKGNILFILLMGLVGFLLVWVLEAKLGKKSSKKR